MRPETIREIEFRGREKRHDGTYGPWIYGGYSHADLWPEIIDYGGIEQSVEPETVGQYTGLKDENGVKIFEGDVVDVVPILGIHFRGVVKFNNHTSAFDVFREERGDSACLKDDFSVEVRGNVFDNPEFEKYKEVYFRED